MGAERQKPAIMMIMRVPLRHLLIVVAIGFVLRLLPLALPFEFSGPDSVTYVAPATSLAAGQGYSDADGQPTAARPPGYPVFLAAIFKVSGGPSPLAVRGVQALLGGSSAALVVLLLAGAGSSSRVALGGGLLMAVDPIAIGQSPFLLREAWLLFLLAALVTARVACRGRWRFAATAVLLAVLTLTHQLYLLLGGFLMLADLWAARTWTVRRRMLLRWAVLGLVVVLAIVLWARRNQRLTGALSFTASSNAVPAREFWLTSECSNNWLSGDHATGFQAMAFAEERRLVDSLGVEGAKAELWRRTRANWSEHPLRSLGRLLRLNLWYWIEVPGAVRLAAHPRLAWVRWGLLPFQWVRLLCAGAGILLLVRSGQWRRYRAVLGALAFFALAPALLYPIPRYLAPACPLLDVLAVLGLTAARPREAAR